MKIGCFSICATLVAMVLPASSAQAGLIGYTSEAAWTAAIAGYSTVVEDFESSPVGLLGIGPTDIGQFDITLSNTNGNTGIGPAIFGTLPTTVLRAFLNPGTGVSEMSWGNFDVAGSVYGFGFDVDLLDVSGFTIEVGGDQVFFPAAGSTFVGIVSTSPIALASVFTASNEYFELDNVQIAFDPVVRTVPEPTSLAIFGALGLAGCWHRRKR